MGPAIIGALGAIGAGAVGAISNGIQNQQNLNYQSQNLDYQKALQAKIFEREDTAIQRRKRDLEAAGFNPYLAMNGNGAGAGAVVSTQPQHSSFDSTPLQNAIAQAPGAYVDMARSLEQLKQDKLYTSFMKMRNSEQAMYNTDMNYYLMNNYGWLDENGDMHTLYFPNDFFYFSKDQFSRYKKYSLAWQNRKTEYGNSMFNFKSLNDRWKMFQNDVLMSQYNADILKVKRDFAVSDKIEQYILDSIGALTGASNTARGWYDSYQKAHTPPRAQNYRESYQRNRNGYTRERRYY